MNESILLDIINETGSIPITLISTSNWTQFIVQIAVTLVGSAFLFMILGKPYIQSFKEWVFVRKLKRVYKKMDREFLVIRNRTQQGMFDSDGIMIDRDMHLELAEILKDMGDNPIDIYLHTPGGEIFATQAISRLLQQHKGKIRAIVPFYSMSGGTYLALSCDEIYLAKTACLGAVDPQLGNLFKFGSAKAWEEIVKLKGKKAEDSTISFAHMGKQYTDSMRKNVEKLLKDKIKDKAMMKKALDKLTAGDIEHGYPLTKEDLEEIGLPIHKPEPHMERAIELLTDSRLYGVFGSSKKEKKKWYSIFLILKKKKKKDSSLLNYIRAIHLMILKGNSNNG